MLKLFVVIGTAAFGAALGGILTDGNEAGVTVGAVLCAAIGAYKVGKLD